MLSAVIDRVTDWMPEKVRGTLMLRAFGLAKVPMLFLSAPIVEEISEERCAIRIPLNFLTRNHVRSMYIAVLTMGADVAAGLMALEAARKAGAPVVPIFKDLKADFARRAYGDVQFVCEEGAAIYAMVDRAVETGERQNLPVSVTAHAGGEKVADFVLTLSVKRR
jgi:hypothetical protein